MTYNWKPFSSVLWYILSIGSALTISQNTVVQGALSVAVGDVTINHGVSWSIINNSVTAIVGSVYNYGGFYVTSNSDLLGLTLTVTGTNFQNTGTVSFNALNSILTPSFTLAATTFSNTGKIFFAASGAMGIPTMAINGLAWENSGLIVFSESVKTASIVQLGTTMGSVNNEGQICLINEVYQQTTTLSGSGCIDAGNNSNVWTASSLLAFEQDQTVYLSTTTSSFRVEALSLSQTFTVAGWGSGNIIGLGSSIYDFGYSNGQLWLRASLISPRFYFNVGTGYNTAAMSIVSTNFGIGSPIVNGGLIYSLPPPSASRPTACKVCSAIPSYPTQSSSSTSSSSATSSFSASFVIPTMPNSNAANPSKSSSLLGTQSPSVSSTEVQGTQSSSVSSAGLSSSPLAVSGTASSVSNTDSTSSTTSDTSSTDSSVFSTRSSSSSGTSSATSTEPSSVSSSILSTVSKPESLSTPLSSSSELDLTSYTTSFELTDSDGNVATRTGEVLVTTNSAGKLYTSTSIITASISSSPGSPFTHYTTTYEATVAGRDIITKTGEVLVTTDSDGELYTVTSVISKSVSSSLRVGSSLSHYTIIYECTAPDGAVVTRTGDVLVTTNSEGELYTTTSEIIDTSSSSAADTSCSSMSHATSSSASSNESSHASHPFSLLKWMIYGILVYLY